MLKRKKFTQTKKFFMPRADRPKGERAKERERMAEALKTYQGPITKCPPASGRVAKRPSRPS